MIAADWSVARLALQIMAEQGPGMAYAAVERQEDALFRASLAALGG